jgi:endoglucanase Acf2
LSRYDKEYLSDNSDFINLLVKDIANDDRDDRTFPYLRVFDAYEGHSWASGMGLFADGNNQESSSEAVNAWYALYLWSNVIGNERLKETALYLYSEESASALWYWIGIDRGDPNFSNFRHTFVSLLWGGKVDAATWFSPRPEAKLAIQLLPISPGSSYLGRDTARVQENMMSENELQNPSMFKDYLAMYTAFYDIGKARQEIQLLKKEDIDSANSKSFMEAWILSLEKQKK